MFRFQQKVNTRHERRVAGLEPIGYKNLFLGALALSRTEIAT